MHLQLELVFDLKISKENQRRLYNY